MTVKHVLQQIAEIVRIENAAYLHSPRLLIAIAAVSLLPAVYVVIFLASVWDPTAHSDALPVVLVNLDRDTRYRDQTFNIGRELADTLKARKSYRYIDSDNAESARRIVSRGDAAFALVIPENLSANALPGNKAGAGKFEVYTSEGNSFQAATLARRFAGELSQEINDRLNERRWSLVLTAATGSEQSIERLRSATAILKRGSTEVLDGSTRLNRGAHELRKRTRELDVGVDRLAEGSREFGKAIHALEARQPSAEDLDHLKTGSEELVAGHEALGRGLVELKGGSSRLRGGLTEFRDSTQSSLFVSNEVQQAASRMAEGMVELDTGLQNAVSGQKQLALGSAQVHEKLALLVDGAKVQAAAIGTMGGKVPPDAQLDALKRGSESIANGITALADGSERLDDGARRLGDGFALLADALPAAPPGMEGSAEGLLHSVEPVVLVDAPVPNNGNAYATNVIPAALWLGAGIAAFLVNLRILPLQAATLPPLASFVSKLALPVALVGLQGLVVLLTVTLLLKVLVVNIWAVSLTVIVSGLTFLLIVLALTRAFGDVGKALAILLLALQISSSGGVMPVELSGGVYAALSPWLPLTWVVKSLKAGMFGAYDGQWATFLLPVGAMALVSTWLGARIGHWRYVDAASIKPPVDI